MADQAYLLGYQNKSTNSVNEVFLCMCYTYTRGSIESVSLTDYSCLDGSGQISIFKPSLLRNGSLVSENNNFKKFPILDF